MGMMICDKNILFNSEGHEKAEMENGKLADFGVR